MYRDGIEWGVAELSRVPELVDGGPLGAKMASVLLVVYAAWLATLPVFVCFFFASKKFGEFSCAMLALKMSSRNTTIFQAVVTLSMIISRSRAFAWKYNIKTRNFARWEFFFCAIFRRQVDRRKSWARGELEFFR